MPIQFKELFKLDQFSCSKEPISPLTFVEPTDLSFWIPLGADAGAIFFFLSAAEEEDDSSVVMVVVVSVVTSPLPPPPPPLDLVTTFLTLRVLVPEVSAEDILPNLTNPIILILSALF